MGRLRDLFFEEVVETPEVIYDEECIMEDYDVEVNTENVTQDNLITDIYSQNDLSDLSKSIFKVEELINSLPKEMPDTTKKATVLSILTSFGLTVEEMLADAEIRSSVIKSALDSIIETNEDVIDNNNTAIEQKKLEIQNLEKDNSDRMIVIKNTDDKVDAEIKRINGLVKFIGGNV